MDEFKGKEIEIQDYIAVGGRSLIRVSEWTNGEGYDITVDDKYIQMTHQAWNAVVHLMTGILVLETE